MSKTSPETETLLSRLDERVSAYNRLLAEPAWKASRSHIETARNLMQDAAAVLRGHAPRPDQSERIKSLEEQVTKLLPLAETLHSLTPRGGARDFAFRIILDARSALTSSPDTSTDRTSK